MTGSNEPWEEHPAPHIVGKRSSGRKAIERHLSSHSQRESDWDETPLGQDHQHLLTEIDKLLQERIDIRGIGTHRRDLEKEEEIESLQSELMELTQKNRDLIGENRELKQAIKRQGEQIQQLQEGHNKVLKENIKLPSPSEMYNFSRRISIVSFALFLSGVWATSQGVLHPLATGIGGLILLFVSISLFVFSSNIESDERTGKI